MTGNVDTMEIWLNYFNTTLYKNGVINKNEFNKMIQLIRKNATHHRVETEENPSKTVIDIIPLEYSRLR